MKHEPGLFVTRVNKCFCFVRIIQALVFFHSFFSSLSSSTSLKFKRKWIHRRNQREIVAAPMLVYIDSITMCFSVKLQCEYSLVSLFIPFSMHIRYSFFFNVDPKAMPKHTNCMIQYTEMWHNYTSIYI